MITILPTFKEGPPINSLQQIRHQRVVLSLDGILKGDVIPRSHFVTQAFCQKCEFIIGVIFSDFINVLQRGHYITIFTGGVLLLLTSTLTFICKINLHQDLIDVNLRIFLNSFQCTCYPFVVMSLVYSFSRNSLLVLFSDTVVTQSFSGFITAEIFQVICCFAL